jgi:hypothetical protein
VSQAHPGLPHLNAAFPGVEFARKSTCIFQNSPDNIDTRDEDAESKIRSDCQSGSSDGRRSTRSCDMIALTCKLLIGCKLGLA